MHRSGPPVFHRSPRLLPDLPGGELEIPAPPPMPNPPHVSILSVLMYLLPGLLGAVVFYFSSRAHGGQGSSYMFYSLPMMGIGGMLQVGMYLYQKERYRRAVQDREQKYTALLERQGQELQQLRLQQQEGLRRTDPDPGQCLDRAERLDPRLWERSPQDPDALALRLGVGAVPFAVAIKAPKPNQPIDPDPLCLQAQDLANQYAGVDGVPIRLALREVGVAGLAGPRPAVIQAARNLALQVAVHHSPEEVQLAAIFPEAEAAEWAWLRWLPHVWQEGRRQRLLAADAAGAHQLLGRLQEVLTRRRQTLALQAGGGAPPGGGLRPGGAGGEALPPLPWFVVLIADPELAEGEPALGLLLREGPSLGAFPVVLAGGRELLPKECRGMVEVMAGSGQLIQTAPAQLQTPFAPDEVPVEMAERLARALAPVRLHQMAAAAEIPARVTLLELLGINQIDDLNPVARWQAHDPQHSLGVPIGLGAGGEPVILDLHERGHGPHGLVAGATGSGKSELLQTLVAALAAQYHPHELAFVMVDYKGGGMANVFRGLPHLIGTITNLDGNLSRRALAALKAELKRRQQLLAAAGVEHIDKYIRARRRGQPLEPLPHLVLLVDEFAELKAEQPDFMHELISAVRVGRSLGVHLILATQKPAGVVDEQIWSNTRFRICLRVERPQDSQEVIKSPEAASITRSGRAYLQVGNNERFELFQAGWGGAPYVAGSPEVAPPGAMPHPGATPHPGAAPGAPPPEWEVAEVALDGSRIPLGARPAPATAAGSEATRSQLAALVEHLAAAAQQAGIQPLPGPWLPPLPAEVVLDPLRPAAEGWDGRGWRPAAGGLAPVVGLADDPARQRQEPLALDLAGEGHLAVYGAPGTGKTTLLQTLVTSLALSHSPAEVQIYLLDCSGRGLGLLGHFPHVGAVIPGDETERLQRLLRLLLQELEERKERLAAAGVNTLTAYRAAGGEPIPALVVAIDDYPTLAAAAPEVEEQLVQIAREGGSLGLHLILTAGSTGAIRSRMANNITLAVALSLADRTEYAAAVGRTGGLEPMALPGRALVKGSPPLEFQTALPVAGEAEWERSTALKALAGAMDQAWTGPRPRPVRSLPEVVPLHELLSAGGEVGAATRNLMAGGAAAPVAVPVGLEVESLEPFRADLREGPHFLISGPPESGKTTLLQTWVLALAASLPPEALQLWLVDMGMGGLAPLARLPHLKGYISDGDGLDQALDQLAALLQERRDALVAARRAGVREAGLPRGGPVEVAAAREEGSAPAPAGAPGNAQATATPQVPAAAAPGWGASQPPLVVVAIDDFDACRDGASPGARDQLEQMIRRDRGLGLHLLVAGQAAVLNQSYDAVAKALKELQTGFALGSTDHTDLSLFNLRLPAAEAGKFLPPGMGYYIRRGRARRFKAATAQAGEVTLGGWVDEIVRRAESRHGANSGPA